MTDSIYTRRDFVSASALAALAVFGGTLLTACAPKKTVTPVPPVGTGTGSTTPSTGSTGTFEPLPPDILSKYEMPHYPGSLGIDKFKFKWPSMEYQPPGVIAAMATTCGGPQAIQDAPAASRVIHQTREELAALADAEAPRSYAA